MTMRAAAVLARLLALALLAVTSAPSMAEDKLTVVATFSILGDFVKAVGGERVDVTSLVGTNGDAHVYAPTPADARKLASARLVVANGLGFEGWMARLVKASGSKARLVIASEGAKLRRIGGSHAHRGEHAGDVDPHAWQSIANAKRYVANIRDALMAADPQGKAIYGANAQAYLAELDALETEVRETIAAIAPERRRIITSHDAFGYFQDAYGLAFIAPQGVSTDAEASAKDVARIIAQVRRERIPALFIENVSDARMIERIAAETGAKIGGALYSDALTPATGDAPTYIDMMRHNVRELRKALAG